MASDTHTYPVTIYVGQVGGRVAVQIAPLPPGIEDVLTYGTDQIKLEAARDEIYGAGTPIGNGGHQSHGSGSWTEFRENLIRNLGNPTFSVPLHRMQ